MYSVAPTSSFTAGTQTISQTIEFSGRTNGPVTPRLNLPTRLAPATAKPAPLLLRSDSNKGLFFGELQASRKLN